MRATRTTVDLLPQSRSCMLVKGGRKCLSSPMIQATKLSVHFDARFSQGPTGGVTKAIDRVDLEIRRGEIFSLVGESGSGKTTLGRAIAGLIKPTDGVVKI